jgi:hypothetical protein
MSSPSRETQSSQRGLSMLFERRRAERVPVGFYVQQYIQDEPHRCFTTDLSPVGLFAEQPFQSFGRRSGVLQLELQLPDTSDTLWIGGEVIYDRLDNLFHGSAIRFTAMARKHQRMLREWLREARRSHMPNIGRTSGTVQVLRPPQRPTARRSQLLYG